MYIFTILCSKSSKMEEETAVSIGRATLGDPGPGWGSGANVMGQPGC